ncbi:hypothetical protein D3C73_696670 [compost metagenome]
MSGKLNSLDMLRLSVYPLDPFEYLPLYSTVSPPTKHLQTHRLLAAYALIDAPGNIAHRTTPRTYIQSN